MERPEEFTIVGEEINYLRTTFIILTIYILPVVAVNSGSYETCQFPKIHCIFLIGVFSHIKCESRLITGSKDDGSISMYYKLRNSV